jgi:hypothetical protein
MEPAQVSAAVCCHMPAAAKRDRRAQAQGLLDDGRQQRQAAPVGGLKHAAWPRSTGRQPRALQLLKHLLLHRRVGGLRWREQHRGQRVSHSH